MTVERAIDILTPDKTRYTPQEYAQALDMARYALAYLESHSVAASIEIMRISAEDGKEARNGN